MIRKAKSALRQPLWVVVLAPFVLLAPVLFQEKALFWGTPALQFVPWWSYAWQSLRAGSMPLWNPLVGMGAPLLANYQSAIFYPPNWTYFLLAAVKGVPGIAWGQAWLAALHLAWAGLGMGLVTRRLGSGGLAQAVSGLAFGLSGYLVARAGFLSINAAAAWLPWALLAVGVGKEPGKRLEGPLDRRVLLLGLVFAMQFLAGHAQTAVYTVILAGLWAGFWGWFGSPEASVQNGLGDRIKTGLGGLGQAWLRLGLGLALAGGLALVQLLPTAEYLTQSQRAGAVDFDLAMTYSAWPWRLLSLLAPDLFGNPAHGDFWGYGNFWEDALYVGLLPFLLALFAIFSRQAKPPAARTGEPAQAGAARNPLRWFLLALLGASVLLALGKNTPVFPWLYRHVPGFDMFQAPARYLIWAEAALALLAGMGAERWRRPQKRSLYWTRLGTAGAVSISLAAGIARLGMGDVSPTFIRATLLAGGWAFAAGVLSLLAPPAESAVKEEDRPGGNILRRAGRWITGRPGVWAWAVVIVVSADLLAAGWGLNPGADLKLYARPSPSIMEIQAQVGDTRLYLPAADEYRLKFKRFFQFRTFHAADDWHDLRTALIPNLNILDGQPSANNFDPLVPGRYAEWMEKLERTDPENRRRLLNLMGAGVVERVSLRTDSGVRFNPTNPLSDPDAAGVLSRWRWVPCAQTASSEADALRLVYDPQIDLNALVILEDRAQAGVQAAGGAETGGCLPGGSPQVSLASESPNKLVLHTTSERPGWLVLSDVWYPGWRAWVDGEAAPVLRANYLFRAVELEAGVHEVVFAYRPLSFWLGFSASLVLWVSAAVLLFRRASLDKISRRIGAGG